MKTALLKFLRAVMEDASRRVEDKPDYMLALELRRYRANKKIDKVSKSKKGLMLNNNNDLRTLNEWAETCHEISKEHGWWEGYEDDISPDDWPQLITTKLALIHSEIDELGEIFDTYAEQIIPPNELNRVGEESADILIRSLDLAAFLKLDLDDGALALHWNDRARTVAPNVAAFCKGKTQPFRLLHHMHKGASDAIELVRKAPWSELSDGLTKCLCSVINVVIGTSWMLDVNIDQALRSKIKKNIHRPHRHGNLRL